MLRRIGCLAFSLALLTSHRADAANGTVSLSWDGCSPIVQDKTTTTPGSYSLIGSVEGCDVGHTRYQVRIVYADEQVQVPDSLAVRPERLPGIGATRSNDHRGGRAEQGLPELLADRPTLEITDLNFTPPTEAYSTTTMRIWVAKAYPSGVVANPSMRYFLLKATFAMDFATAGPTVPGETCGGMEKALCFKLIRAEFIDLDGKAQYFSWSNQVNATWNGGAACAAIPARATTWGGIKAQYRD